MWRNLNTNETSLIRPLRVRLEDRTTRTNDDITDEQLADAGWVFEEDVIPSATGPMAPTGAVA